MSGYSITEPTLAQKCIAGVLVVGYALLTILPLIWIIATGFKSPSDAIAYPPKVVFEPTLEGYVNLFTTRTRMSPEALEEIGPPETWYDRIVRQYDMVISGPSRYGERFLNSVVIGFGSTFLSVFLGTLAAYAFSRFKVPLKDDLMFFILSTRMMPPIAVAIPIFLMFRQLGLSDTHLGMILLYTAVNVSLAVWLLKGFIDEIPREYEEAALIDGCTYASTIWRITIPLATPAIASVALYTFMIAWNEFLYAFLFLFTKRDRWTLPLGLQQLNDQEVPVTALMAGSLIISIPIIVIFFFFERFLTRGLTAGAVKG